MICGHNIETIVGFRDCSQGCSYRVTSILKRQNRQEPCATCIEDSIWVMRNGQWEMAEAN